MSILPEKELLLNNLKWLEILAKYSYEKTILPISHSEFCVQGIWRELKTTTIVRGVWRGLIGAASIIRKSAAALRVQRIRLGEFTGGDYKTNCSNISRS